MRYEAVNTPVSICLSVCQAPPNLSLTVRHPRRPIKTRFHLSDWATLCFEPVHYFTGMGRVAISLAQWTWIHVFSPAGRGSQVRGLMRLSGSPPPLALWSLRSLTFPLF
jgi:hypothetical protein